MLRVTCADIGISGCGFVAESGKIRTLERKMLEHLREAHPDFVGGLSDGEYRALVRRIKAGMHGLEPAPVHEVDRHPMLRIRCAAFGTTGCDFVAEDCRMHRVEEKFFDHLRDRHPEIVAGLGDGDYWELKERVEAAIERAAPCMG
jgi:predicted small metal-binding protein